MGWMQAGSRPQDYEVGTDRKEGQYDKTSGYLKSRVRTPKGFVTLMQRVQASNYLGQRVRLSGFLKSEEVRDRAGLWMQVDASQRQGLSFEDMRNQQLQGTIDWQRYEIVLDVPVNSISISFGVRLDGPGQIWVCDLQFSVVGLEVPTTDLQRNQSVRGYPEQPLNLDFETPTILPDGPKTPNFLHTVQWVTNPVALLESCAQRYGDPFTLWGNSVFISNPQAIEVLFTAKPDLFECGWGNLFLRPMLGENSLLLLDGERHQRQRQLLTPPFHGERMRTYGQIICAVTLAVSLKWTVGNPFTVRSSMQAIALQVILQAVFGLREGPRYQQLSQLLTSLLNLLNSPLSASLLFFPALQRDWGSWSPWGRFLHRKQQIDQLLDAEIRQRREQGDYSGTDILTLLMSARDEAGQPMTDAELRHQLMTLLVAGHESTASALSWALYWVHRFPEVRDKLLNELASLGANPNPSAIARLPYLNAVCQETLRICPVAMVAFGRVLKAPIQIMGYEFGPGTWLYPCIYLAHQREDLYPEPKRFKPERFLERQFSTYEYLPFGGSNRRCVGLAFAQFEMKLVLATILSHFQLALVNKRPVQPVPRGITLSPPSDLRMVLLS